MKPSNFSRFLNEPDSGGYFGPYSYGRRAVIF